MKNINELKETFDTVIQYMQENHFEYFSTLYQGYMIKFCIQEKYPSSINDIKPTKIEGIIDDNGLETS